MIHDDSQVKAMTPNPQRTQGETLPNISKPPSHPRSPLRHPAGRAARGSHHLSRPTRADQPRGRGGTPRRGLLRIEGGPSPVMVMDVLEVDHG